jgi:hypothetical protein
LVGLSYSQVGGYALDFDGSNDYVSIPDHNSMDIDDNSFSMSMWVKFDDSEGFNRTISIVSKSSNTSNNGYIFPYVGAVSKIRLIVSTPGWDFDNGFTISTTDAVKWNFLTGTYDGSNRKIYLNGVHMITYSQSGNISTNSNSLIIGNQPGYSERYKGQLDEISIWDKVLSQSEIKAMMHDDLDGNETDLVAYYKMSNGSGTSLTDNSSNSNTGTLTNMDNSDWVTSYAPIGDLGSSYKTDVEAIWSISGTSETDASDGLTMTVSGALSTVNFAVFGNNNTSSTSTSDIGAVGSTVRTGRIWQVDESGTVTATIKIDMSDATGVSGNTGTASNYRLLYRSGTSGDFSSTATGSSISGDVVTFNSISLQDGYYALGAQSDASLPVELTSFELMSTREGGITLQWITESEINNLGFILDRRTPTMDWTQIANYITHQELQGQGSVSHQTIYTYTDNTVQENETYDYRLADVDHDGNVEYHSTQLMGVSTSSTLPEQYVLHQNYPNPFNPITTLRYELPEASYVNVTIYDILGNMVNNLVDANQSSGYKTIQWNATNNQGQPVSAGVYLYKIQAGNFVDTNKMILLK